MHGHPTTGLKNIKPRIKTAKEEIRKLSRIYLVQRNSQMKAKNQREQMLLAKARDELILKELVVKQAAFLLVSMRQKMLGAPDAWCRRILNLSDPAKAKAILREMIHGMLTELADLPNKVTDPGWLKTLESEEKKP